MILSFFTVFLPLMLLMAAFQFKWSIAASMTTAYFVVVTWYPIFTHVLLIAYITPYRTAALRVLRYSPASMIFEKQSRTSIGFR